VIEGSGLPFQEANEFFSGKVNLPTRKSDDLRHHAHVRAFSVAGVVRDDMLSDFRAAIEKARVQGTGLSEFRKDFDAIVDRTGWRFKALGSTDEERRAWRARIIYRTNMRTSYMAGRWRQMTDPDVLRYRPFWRYKHSGSRHPRKTHLALDEKVFAWDDPIWEVYFPPNGFGCECDVEALSRRQMRALGKEGPDTFPLPGAYESRDPRTGDPEVRYPGIDRGWEYNVGRAWTDGVVPQELHQPLAPVGTDAEPPPAGPMPPPRPAPPARLLPDNLPPEQYVESFMGAFDLSPNEAALHRDPSGGVVTVSRALFETRDREGSVTGLKAGKRGRGQFALLLADTILDPDEIWVDWAMVASGIVLKRAYLRRIILPDATQLLVRFEWTSKGWTAVTGFDTSEGYIRSMRTGALLYRRAEE
jgi:SPP1 gp7 family putative phage head morphogenesis protein